MVTRHRVVFTPVANACGPLAVALLLTACATPSQTPCAPGEDYSVMETLYFGTNIPGGGQVSAEEWREFRDKVVTPRFPDGLTAFKAQGQWRNKAGDIESESTWVLQVVHPGSAATATSIGELSSIYQTRFKQEAVLRVRSASCISLGRASG